MLDAPAMAELKSLAPLLKDPAHTTIVTEHGTEWWSAWWLRVHIAQAESFLPEDREEGEDYLFLDVKTGRTELVGRGGPQAGGPPPGGPPPGGQPPGEPPPGAPTRPAETPREVVHDGPYLRLTR